MNTQTETLIREVAKTNKYSVVKLTELVEQALVLNRSVRGTGNPVGRPKSSDAHRAVAVVNELRASGEQFTASVVALKAGVSQVVANNVIRSLDLVRVGLAEKETGVRGRREIIWA